MFYHFLYPLKDLLFELNIFRYITFRSALAVIFSLLVFLLTGRRFINFLKDKTGNILRKLTPEGHQKKKGTPSMGGLLIVFSVLVSVAFNGNFGNHNVILCLIALVAFASLGFVDDFII